MTTIGEIVLLAKIDTSQYKRGAKEIDQANKNIEGSTEQVDRKTGRATAGLNKLAKAGLAVVAAAAISVGSRIDDAVKRIDTLVAFPKVLQAMGVSADKAESSTSKLSEKLQGLPTALQDGAKGVQNFVAAGLGVDRATDAFLGLNNALIAGNADAQDTQIVMDSLTRAISAGEVPASTMTAIFSRMPTVMQALTKSTGKSSTELQKMFANDPQKLIDAIIDLNKKGSGGLSSLEDQARESTKGIGTSFSNMGNAIDRGLQSIVTAIGGGDLERGQARISDAINTVGKAFERVLNLVGVAIGGIISGFKPLISVLNANREAVLILGSTYAILKSAMAIDAAIASLRMGFIAQTVATVGLRGGLQALISSIRLFMVSIGPVGWAMAGVSLIAGVLAGKWLSGATAADRQNEAQKRLYGSSVALKDAQDRLKGAQLGVEGASLRTERAEINLKDAVQKYGKKSLEARDASHELKNAKFDLKVATDEAKDATKEHSKAEFDYAKNGALIKSADAKALAIQGLVEALGQSITTGEGENEKTTKPILSNPQDILRGFATGGFTGRGGADEIAGLVHRGEYVIPKDLVDQNTGEPKVANNQPAVIVNLRETKDEMRRGALKTIELVNEVYRSRGIPQIGVVK